MRYCATPCSMPVTMSRRSPRRSGIDQPQKAVTSPPSATQAVEQTMMALAESVLDKIGRASCKGKSVSVRVDLGGRRLIKNKKHKNDHKTARTNTQNKNSKTN